MNDAIVRIQATDGVLKKDISIHGLNFLETFFFINSEPDKEEDLHV